MLGYEQFGQWYDRHCTEVLEPAMASAATALDALLTDAVSDRDLARIRNTTGRVKSKRRTWRKLRQPRYKGRFAEPGDIPHVIDDLIGLRITCTNLRDIDMVQAALDSLPRSKQAGHPLWLDSESERDYVLRPKESGYRGWHVNLGIVVASGDDIPVTAELQVRTLLQDSWGELTHEDTYSKDGALPPLVEVLSKRMADLFATLDDIAEDLRTELDRIDDAVVEAVVEADDADGTTFGEIVVGSEQARDADTVLRDRWRQLDRPIDLASLAWTLQREFGAEISDDWFGHRSFKRFVSHAVPDAEISTGRRAYLLPPPADARPPAVGRDVEVDDPLSDPPDGRAPIGERGAAAVARTGSTVPDQARELRRVDQGLPLLERDQWPALYAYLAEAWSSLGAHEPTTRFVNQLSRLARDRATADRAVLSRRHVDYVAKAVLSTDGDGRPLDRTEIARAFAEVAVQRMTDLRILDPEHVEALAAIRRWLIPV